MDIRDSARDLTEQVKSAAKEATRGASRDADHPLWQFLTHLTTVTAITIFLWFNASHFDKTEIKTIVQVAGLMLGTEVVKRSVIRNR